MGINVGNWPLDRLDAAVRRFIDIIASAHRDKWIFCIDLFTFYADLTEKPMQTCRGFRDVVRHLPGVPAGGVIDDQNPGHSRSFRCLPSDARLEP